MIRKGKVDSTKFLQYRLSDKIMIKAIKAKDPINFVFRPDNMISIYHV